MKRLISTVALIIALNIPFVGAKAESPPPICYAGQTCYNWMESGSSTYLVSPSDCKLKRIAPNAFYIECE